MPPCQWCFCRIMDKHLKSLCLRHLDTKFIKLDAEVSPMCFYLCCNWILLLQFQSWFVVPLVYDISNLMHSEILNFWDEMQNAPFFIAKLGIKTLPCVILFRSVQISYPHCISFGNSPLKCKTCLAVLQSLVSLPLLLRQAHIWIHHTKTSWAGLCRKS